MSDSHRSKRRRLNHVADQFLDLEAVVDRDELSKSERDSDDEQFIVTPEEDEEHNDERQQHARLFQTLLRADDSAPADAEQQDPDRDPPAALLQDHDHPVITDATECVVEIVGGPKLSAGIWEMRCGYGREQAMVDRVQTILQGSLPDLPPHNCVLAVNWTPQLRGRIFIEIADGPDAPQQQLYLLTALDALVWPQFYQKRFLPFHGMAQWMKNWTKTRMPHTFARIKRFSCYRGDLAYIFPRNDALWLAIVPRIPLNPNFKGTRSARSTVTPRDIQLSKLTNKRVDVFEENQYFTFKGNTLTIEGYLLIHIEDVDLFPEINPSPTYDDLERFKDLAQMPSHIRNDYFLGSIQRHLSVHDRVQITRGEYQGQVGIVYETSQAEAEVYFPDEDTLGTVLLEDLRGHLEVGDHVSIQYGTHKGRVGYIVNCLNGMVTVADPSIEFEVEIPAEHVVFWERPFRLSNYSIPPFEIGDEVIVHTGPDRGLEGVIEAVRDKDIVIREGEFFPPEFSVPVYCLRRLDASAKPGLPLCVGAEVEVTIGGHHGRAGSIIQMDRLSASIKEGPSHPNVYTIHSCHVRHTSTPKRNDLVLAMREGEGTYDPYRMWIGKACSVVTGPLKGYRGWVTNTHPSGLITVRHEARLQQSAQYPFESLAMHEQHPHLEAPRVPSPIPVRQSTPLPDDVPDRPLSPAWDPAAPPPALPVIPPEPDELTPPTWLQEPEFRGGYKIFLRDEFGAGRSGFFSGMESDGRVRFNGHLNDIETLPLAMLRHVTPKVVGDLVVPLRGDFKGKIMKVTQLGQVCTLKEYAKRNRSKKYVAPVMELVHLARIAPS